jgi:hypothetical protein
MTAAGQRIASLDMKVTAIAAAYLEAGKGPADVAALARLFDAAPAMESRILAAMDELDRIAAEDGTR